LCALGWILPRMCLPFMASMGFNPDFTDTYEKADRGHKECLCRSEGSSVRSSSTALLSRSSSRASVALKWLGCWIRCVKRCRCSLRTEQADDHWTKRFIYFYGKPHPLNLGTRVKEAL